LTDGRRLECCERGLRGAPIGQRRNKSVCDSVAAPKPLTGELRVSTLAMLLITTSLLVGPSVDPGATDAPSSTTAMVADDDQGGAHAHRHTGAKCPGMKDDPRPHIVGTEDPDHLTGTHAAEVICGFNGNDVIFGRGGDDVIKGGPDADRIQGGAGNDRIFAHSGRRRDHWDRDIVEGNGGDDWIWGGWSHDRISGGSGNDHLFGGRGYDTLVGNRGIDTLNGGRDHDNCSNDRSDTVPISCGCFGRAAANARCGHLAHFDP
jgi:hypothetical protein